MRKVSYSEILWGIGQSWFTEEIFVTDTGDYMNIDRHRGNKKI